MQQRLQQSHLRRLLPGPLRLYHRHQLLQHQIRQLRGQRVHLKLPPQHHQFSFVFIKKVFRAIQNVAIPIVVICFCVPGIFSLLWFLREPWKQEGWRKGVTNHFMKSSRNCFRDIFQVLDWIMVRFKLLIHIFWLPLPLPLFSRDLS